MRHLTTVLALLALGLALPGAARADVDPAGCTDDLQYDTSIPTFSSVIGDELGGDDPASVDRHPSPQLRQYADALVAATSDSPRVRILRKRYGTSALGQPLVYYVIGATSNIANLDAGRNDGAFWSGVVSGSVSEADGLAAVRTRPAFAWVTETPHGNEPAGGEATLRLLYELAARLDCQNAQRLRNLTLFVNPVRNPDGRDEGPIGVRTTAWNFDPNRDFGVRTQVENATFMPELIKYPGLFYIDAHQQAMGYFFPPNEDPVHHELSDFTIDTIQNKIGPTLQQKFNDQSAGYQNYNTYDLFTPEYGDTVPSLLMGAAGMTYEKGETESYGKQVYDHYLAMDATVNLTSDDKPRMLRDWVRQWQQASDEGAACTLEPNQLVSPLHTGAITQPTGNVCGYFFRPGSHSGDVAHLVTQLQEVGVQVFRLDAPVTLANGVHEIGSLAAPHAGTLPAGTIWVPNAQPTKHWIQAVLEEDPVIPFAYFYDVVSWSYTLNRGLAGDGTLTQNLPSGAQLSAIGTPSFGTFPSTPATYYAWATDSMTGLGLTIDVLAKGAAVTRTTQPFAAADGRRFPTGTALVAATALTAAGVDLPALARARQTPVSGLPSRPVASVALRKPKIGLYAGAQEPTNPAPAGAGTKGHCGGGAGLVEVYCEALFTLKVKDGIPVTAVTDADLPRLITDGYTALINPDKALVPNGALQAWVNQGGIYVGSGTLGSATALAGGMTTVNADPTVSVTTPGTTYDATYRTGATGATGSPVAWGFDDGGFIYRASSDDPAYDPSTLAGAPPAIPAATAAISYKATPHPFGYQVGTTGPSGALNGRPFAVDQRFGSGHAVLIGTDPFYRAWHEGSERVVLNAALSPIAAATPPGAKAVPAEKAEEPAAAPVAPAALPAVTPARTLTVARPTARDVRITVPASDAAGLRRAVRAAHLQRRVRRRVHYVRRRQAVVLVIRGVRTADEEDRKPWVGRIMGELATRRIKPISAQL